MRQFFTKANLNFPKLWKTAVPVSAVLCIVSLVFFFIVGKGLLGVDFTGGTQVTFNYEKQIPATEIEKALSALKYQATVNYKFSAGGDEGRKLEILIRDDMTERINDPNIVNTEVDNPKEIISSYLNKKYPEAKLSGGQETSVGGLIGFEFTKAALWAIFFSMIGIGAYLTLRYEFSYAAASLTALAFDVIIVMGIYAALGRTISLTVVAAILTVIGYSVNDKVVVFDRVRENVRSGVKGSYLETITESLNQTLSRTILTSLTTFIVVLILFIWGGIAINDFVLIMMLGVIVGTYSSMFIAAPFTVFWNRKVAKLDVIEDDEMPLLEKQENK